jgi:hypothetical protein
VHVDIPNTSSSMKDYCICVTCIRRSGKEVHYAELKGDGSVQVITAKVLIYYRINNVTCDKKCQVDLLSDSSLSRSDVHIDGATWTLRDIYQQRVAE